MSGTSQSSSYHRVVRLQSPDINYYSPAETVRSRQHSPTILPQQSLSLSGFTSWSSLFPIRGHCQVWSPVRNQIVTKRFTVSWTFSDEGILITLYFKTILLGENYSENFIRSIQLRRLHGTVQSSPDWRGERKELQLSDFF